MPRRVVKHTCVCVAMKMFIHHEGSDLINGFIHLNGFE
jgi:hypothetical protein